MSDLVDALARAEQAEAKLARKTESLDEAMALLKLRDEITEEALQQRDAAQARLAEVTAERDAALSDNDKLGNALVAAALGNSFPDDLPTQVTRIKAVVELAKEITGGWEEAYIKDELAAVAIPADKALALLAAVTALTEGEG